MSEDVEIKVRIGERVFTVQFDNDTPYRGAALEDLEFLKETAVSLACSMNTYIERMPTGKR
jgi:hypothetical protein